MKVRTLRDHDNDYPPTYRKTNGRIYELPDLQARALIDRGLVEAYDGESKAAGVSGTGANARRAPKSNG